MVEDGLSGGKIVLKRSFIKYSLEVTLPKWVPTINLKFNRVLSHNANFKSGGPSTMEDGQSGEKIILERRGTFIIP